jgi:hypothetical protein
MKKDTLQLINLFRMNNLMLKDKSRSFMIKIYRISIKLHNSNKLINVNTISLN